MIYPHLLYKQDVTYGQDGSAGLTRTVFTNTSIDCFFQCKDSADQQPNLNSQVEKQYSRVYFLDANTFADIQLDQFIKVEGVTGSAAKYFKVRNRKNLCGLNRVYRIDVEESLVEDIV